MQPAAEHRTLVVANRTAATPLLLQAILDRAALRPTAFVLLVPNVSSRGAADWTLNEALKAMRKAASGVTGMSETNVTGLVGGPDAFESIRKALADDQFDDVIISTLPKRTSEWLRRDLPRRVEHLGVPVTVITPPKAKRPSIKEIGGFTGPPPG